MAINIIKEGNKEKKPIYKRTCPECGCVFEYDINDTQEVGWRGGFIGVACPCCKYMVAHIINGGDNNHPLLED